MSGIHGDVDSWTRGPLARLADGVLLVAGLSLVVLALVEGWQVFARYVLNDSPSWTEPVAVLCMKLAMMLGAAAGVRAQGHFGFFIGVHAAPPALRRLMLDFSRLLQAAIGLMLCFWGLLLGMENWEVSMPGAALPQGVGYLPLSIGGALIALFAIELFVRARGPSAEAA
jgi:TRAP-type C4-dicarboxylate transport system permease small subunit